MTADLTDDRLRRLQAVLLEAYGPQHWWPGQSRFEISIGAILVQNTSWTNAARALARLEAQGLLHPAELLECDERVLMEAVRPSGIYRQKTRRVLVFTRWLCEQAGFDALARWDTARLRVSLLALHGIGPETADCILLYALGRPVFVVDAYTLRIFARLGLYDSKRDGPESLRNRVHACIGGDVPFFNEFHALMVEHGKQFCRPRPRCAQCVLQARCGHAQMTPGR